MLKASVRPDAGSDRSILMTIGIEHLDTRFRSPVAAPQRSVHCDRLGVDMMLGPDRVLSTHRTSDGVVAYLRCHCGSVVLARADGLMKHAHSTRAAG